MGKDLQARRFKLMNVPRMLTSCQHALDLRDESDAFALDVRKAR